MARYGTPEKTLTPEEYFRKFEDEYDIEFVSPTEALDALQMYIKTTTPQKFGTQHFMLIGEPGCAKSAMVFQACAAENLYPLEVRISCSDEGIMVGCPTKTEDGAFRYSIDQNIKDKFEEAKSLGKRVMVFFDEANRGKQHMINAMFNILDNRTWAGYKLPEDTLFCVAVNPATEMHSVVDIMREAALNRRFIILGVEPSAKSLLAYAATKPRFHKLIQDFIRSNPKSIMEIGKMNQGKKYLCPAVLESLALRFTTLEEQGMDLAQINSNPGLIRLICGAAGKSSGMAIIEFIQNRIRNIEPSTILEDYDSIREMIKAKEKKIDQGLVVSVAKSVADYIAAYEVNFSEKPTQAKNLARFMNDLNDEVLRTFINHLHGAFTNPATKDQYIAQMSEALTPHEEFINATKRMHSGYRKAEKSFER